jgi:hypothetical protein
MIFEWKLSRFWEKMSLTDLCDVNMHKRMLIYVHRLDLVHEANGEARFGFYHLDRCGWLGISDIGKLHSPNVSELRELYILA